MSSHKLLQRIFRFGITGCTATTIHIAVAYLWMQQSQASSGVANALAYAVATVFSYWAHTLWSFSSQVQAQSIAKFLLVTLLGLTVSAGLAQCVAYLGYAYGYGIAVVVCVIPPLNFLAHHFWTYRVQHPKPI